MILNEFFNNKQFENNSFGNTEPEQQQMDANRRGRLGRERNAGLDEPDDVASEPVQTRNGVYEYTVPAGQESVAQDLGLQQHRGHWVSRVPIQRANFQFGQPQFHEIPTQDVAEVKAVNGGFPFDVDHMHGSRGIGADWADTRDLLQKPFEHYGNYKEWYRDVNRVNSELLDDNAEFSTMSGGKIISINGKDFAFWSNRNGNGSIDIGIAKKHSGQGVAEGSKEKTPGIALSKAYKKDFDNKKPGQDRAETALTGTYSKTGKPGGELKKQGVAEGGNPVDHEWYRKQQERKAKAAKRQDQQQRQQGVAEAELGEAKAKKTEEDIFLKGKKVGSITTTTTKGGITFYTAQVGNSYVAGSDTREESLKHLKRLYRDYYKKQGVAEGTNDYFKRRKDEEDRIAGIKAPAKRTPRQTDYEKKRKEQKRKEQGVAEGMLGNPGEQDSPVAQAIIRRILLQRTDLLSKYGPEKVGQAVDEVADFVGDVDEIGSSDVSGWVKHVEQMLGNMQEGYNVVPGINKDRYQERQGLEGPFNTKSGKVVYYDKQEGKYYDPDTDMYIEYDDWQAMNEQGVAEGEGRFAGDTPVNVGGATMKMIQVGDIVKYLGQKAEVDALSKDRKRARITIERGMGSVTQDVNTNDLRQLGQGVAEGNQVNEVFNIVPNLAQQIEKKENELKALKDKMAARTTTNAGIQTGATALIDPDTGRPYEKDKLAAMYGYKEPEAAAADDAQADETPPAPVAQTPAQIRAAKQKAAAATAQGQMAGAATAPVAQTPAATTATNPVGFNAGNVMKLPGMEKYAKPAAPAKTANFAGPSGYGKTTTSIKPPAAPSSPALSVPKAPAAPRITSGGPTPAEKAALDKRIAAAAAVPAVAETLAQVERMLESVNSKKSADMIRAYVDQRFTELGLRNTNECRNLMAHVVQESAIRRRQYAKSLAN